MKLLSLSGPCGSGKSTLIKIIESNYDFLNSTYKKSRGSGLNPTLYESKIDYMKLWFDEVHMHRKNGKYLIFSDRCPFDSLAYLREKQIQFKEKLSSNFSLLEKKGIDHHSILITADVEILRDRIQNRYNTGKRNDVDYKRELLLLEKSIRFFEENIDFYKLVIDTSNETQTESYKKLGNYVHNILNDQ